MSLLGLAIIGRRNEPLYLCDCVRALHESKNHPKRGRKVTTRTSVASVVSQSSDAGPEPDDPAANVNDASNDPRHDHENTKESDKDVVDDHSAAADDDDVNDPFGFLTAQQNCDLGQSLSFENILFLHSALDYLEERIESTSAGLPVVTNGRTGHWLGCLVRHGDDSDYDNRAADDEDPAAAPAVVVYGYITATNIKMLVLVRPPVSKESTVRLFLNGIHDSYITHKMNPFSSVKPGQRIQSAKFDSHIREAIRDYEDNRLQQEQE